MHASPPINAVRPRSLAPRANTLAQRPVADDSLSQAMGLMGATITYARNSDIFGLEFADEHSLSAEAITDCKILVVKRNALNALAGRDASVAKQLLTLTGCELHRVQNRILLLIKNAQQRVAGFLLEMARRDSPGDVIELPMSRQDIADYLGLTVETVSRTLTSLECVAAIEVTTSRRIVLRNRSALSHLNG